MSYVDVSGCSEIDDKGIKWLTAAEAHLRVGLPPVIPGLLFLTTLKVSLTKVGDSGIESIIANCKNLEHFEISRCTELTDSALQNLGKELP